MDDCEYKYSIERKVYFYSIPCEVVEVASAVEQLSVYAYTTNDGDYGV